MSTTTVQTTRLGRLLALLLTAVVAAGAGWGVAPTPASATPAAIVVPMGVPAGAQCVVRSYSLHALLQMAVRDISAWEVENAVSVSCRQGKVKKQSNGTFIYTGTYVVVVMNSAGNVVTAYYASGGGGGWRVDV